MKKGLLTILLAALSFAFSACANEDNSMLLEDEYSFDQLEPNKPLEPSIQATHADMNAEAANML